ncbi:MAG: hypothetical protein GX640_09310 [Fibrobacter sp.]|nr:hypothetical protein [Fibrobacter sp.]
MVIILSLLGITFTLMIYLSMVKVAAKADRELERIMSEYTMRINTGNEEKPVVSKAI